MKDSGQSSIHCVGEASDSDWWTQPDGSQPEEDLDLCMVTEKPIFVFDKSDKKASGSERKLLSTSVLLSVPQAGRNAALESRRDARSKTRRDLDMRRRK